MSYIKTILTVQCFADFYNNEFMRDILTIGHFDFGKQKSNEFSLKESGFDIDDKKTPVDNMINLINKYLDFCSKTSSTVYAVLDNDQRSSVKKQLDLYKKQETRKDDLISEEETARANAEQKKLDAEEAEDEDETQEPEDAAHSNLKEMTENSESYSGSTLDTHSTTPSNVTANYSFNGNNVTITFDGLPSKDVFAVYLEEGTEKGKFPLNNTNGKLGVSINKSSNTVRNEVHLYKNNENPANVYGPEAKNFICKLQIPNTSVVNDKGEIVGTELKTTVLDTNDKVIEKGVEAHAIKGSDGSVSFVVKGLPASDKLFGVLCSHGSDDRSATEKPGDGEKYVNVVRSPKNNVYYITYPGSVIAKMKNKMEIHIYNNALESSNFILKFLIDVNEVLDKKEDKTNKKDKIDEKEEDNESQEEKKKDKKESNKTKNKKKQKEEKDDIEKQERKRKSPYDLYDFFSDDLAEEETDEDDLFELD